MLHYGRYGGGAEDHRLPPLFLGYPQLVRGYDIGSFDTSECQANPSRSCPAFDRLLGSRTLVGNLELRFPLLRPFGVRQGMYGPLPIEVAFFGDGGVAWMSDDRPTFFGGNRKPVASTGVIFRANFFGFAVGQCDIARPLQRPGKRLDVRVQPDAGVLKFKTATTTGASAARARCTRDRDNTATAQRQGHPSRRSDGGSRW